MTSDYYTKGGRHEANVASKDWAGRDRASWSDEEEEFLIEEWIGLDNYPAERDEETISRILERTIESCRNRAHMIRTRLGLDDPVIVPFVRPSARREYIGAEDDPDECWWTP